jgi:hypothetical protein
MRFIFGMLLCFSIQNSFAKKPLTKAVIAQEIEKMFKLYTVDSIKCFESDGVYQCKYFNDFETRVEYQAEYFKVLDFRKKFYKGVGIYVEIVPTELVFNSEAEYGYMIAAGFNSRRFITHSEVKCGQDDKEYKCELHRAYGISDGEFDRQFEFALNHINERNKDTGFNTPFYKALGE